MQKLMVGAAIAAVAGLAGFAIHGAAAQAQPQQVTPIPVPPGTYLPIGVSVGANFSAAWFVDMRTNRIRVCTESTTAANAPLCNSTALQ